VSVPWLASFPATLSEVTLTPLANVGSGSTVTCRELQWWFAVPRVGDRFGGAWYDRHTGEITRVQELARPIADSGLGDGTVQIDIYEWTRQPGTDDPPTHQRTTLIAALTTDRAEFRKVTIGDDSTQLGDPDFADSWSGGGSCRVVDDGRFEPIGDRRYRTTTATGAGAGIFELTIGQRSFRCLRAIDLPAADGTEEIGQPLIDLESGRTLAYWQYRPTNWDADSASWLASHPRTEIVVDDLVFQRRNCTGRDEIALTVYALGLA